MKKLIFKRLISVCAAIVITAGIFAGVGGLETVETQAKFSESWDGYYNGNFGLNSYAVTLYPGETFQLLTGNIGSVTYTSDNTAIANVSANGLITAGSEGSAVITVTSDAYGSRQCEVLVTANDGTYIKTLDNQISYKMSTNEVYLTTSKAEIYIDKGIAYSTDLVNIIDRIMTAIESVTGYKFITSDYPNKVQIDFPAGYIVSGFADTSGACLSQDEAVPELTECYHVIAHELLHVAQLRNTGENSLMCEGFAETLADEVVAAAGISSTYSTMRNMEVYYTYCKDGIYYYSSNHEYVSSSSSDQVFDLTADNIKQICCDSDDMHPISYFLVRYINETYGLSKVKELLQAINTANAGESKSVSFDIVVSKTASTFTSDFAKWYNSLTFAQEGTTDVGTSSYLYGNCLSVKWIERFTSFNPSFTHLTYKDSITIDMTKAVAFAQNVYGKKYWGMCVSLGGGGNAVFYDADGNVLLETTIQSGTYTYEGKTYNKTDAFRVKGAVKLVVTQSGSHLLDIYDTDPTGMFSKSTETVPIRILSNPQYTYVNEGDTATFTVNATGIGLSYQWFYYKGTSAYPADPNCNGPTLTVTATKDMSGNRYFCLVTDQNGSTARSTSAMLEVASSSTIVTGISLDKTSLEIPTGQSASLTATVAPANATNKNVMWTSSDPSVATVDGNGQVTAVSYGTAVITATSQDGSFQASCTVQTRFYDVTQALVDAKSISSGTFTRIYWAADNGIVQGTKDDKGFSYFNLTGDCTRAQMAVMFYRYAGKPAVSAEAVAAAKAKFSDVSSLSSGVLKAVAWAASEGIISGYNDGTFRPSNSITRASTVVMFWRMAGRPEAQSTSSFTDTASCSSGVMKAINWAASVGITQGTANGDGTYKFAPNDNCQRQHIVTFIYRYTSWKK